MWQPEPGWQQLPGGSGPSTYGVWLAVESGRELVVKRLSAPAPHDPAELRDPRHFAYWRRAADVALAGVTRDTPGLRDLPLVRVEEDDDGVTLVHLRVADDGQPGLCSWLAALGRFAGAELARPALAGPRPAAREAAPGRARWRLADPGPDHGGRRRRPPLDASRELPRARVDALPQVAQHGDPVPANLPGRDGDDVLADRLGARWARARWAPTSGYFALVRPRGLRAPRSTPTWPGCRRASRRGEEVALGARVTAVYTVAHPGRMGPGPGRRRRGRAGREVPPPQRGAVPPGAAAPVPADRGPAAGADAGQGHRQGCPTAQVSQASSVAALVAGLEPLHPRRRRAVGPLLLGSTWPCVFCWIRSSPTALAASMASWMSCVGELGDQHLPSASSVGGVRGPHAGVAVGLQLEPDRVAAGALLGLTWPMVPSRFWMWWPYS